MTRETQLWTPGGPESPTEEQVLLTRKLLRKWQQFFKLDEWRFQVSNQRPSDKNDMEIAVVRARRIASLRLHKVDDYNSRSYEQLVIHEVLHIVFDDIWEEFEFQRSTLPSERQKEYHDRMLNEIEKTVERLSLVVYNS